jgi:hypothetical protein
MLAHTLAALADFPRQLEAHVAAVPPGMLRWTPGDWAGCPSERLTVVEQLWHLRDIEIDGYHVRFPRTLEETHPLLADIDGEALAVQRCHGERDPHQALREFKQARAQTVALLQSLDADAFERTARFDGGTITLRGLVHMLCSHDHQHLAGLQWLLARHS